VLALASARSRPVVRRSSWSASLRWSTDAALTARWHPISVAMSFPRAHSSRPARPSLTFLARRTRFDTF